MDKVISNFESIIGCDNTPLSTAKRAGAIFARIRNYDLNAVIDRYAKDYHLDKYVAEEHFIELKKFLSVCAASDEPIGMAGPVDDAWHIFLIFTREYSAFCEHCGKFIHHVPNTDEGGESSSTGYTTFLQIYELAFDEAPPMTIWPYRRTADGLFASESCAGCGGQGGGGGGGGGGGCSHCSACKNDG